MRGRAVLRGGGRTFPLAAACWFITGCSGPVVMGQPEAQVDGAGTPPHSLSQLDTEFGEFDYRTWTVADGLPENSVTSIVQTRDGYLWIGTFGGLARIDGVRFTVFDIANTDALGTNRILSLLEARVLERTAGLVEANKDLQRRSEELERLNRLFVGREDKMIELKREINEMARAAGKPEPYELSFTDADEQTDGVAP